MDAVSLLLNRHSVPKLCEPAPQGGDLDILLQAALRAPDHAWLRPWRFLLIEGDARNKLGDLYADAALQRDAQASEKVLNKLRGHPLRAPLLLVVIARIQPHPKVPREEQLLSAGCAAHSVLLAAQALGYAGVWRTGENAYDDVVKAGLGLSAEEEIVSYLYLGTKDGRDKVLPELNVADFCQHWS